MKLGFDIVMELAKEFGVVLQFDETEKEFTYKLTKIIEPKKLRWETKNNELYLTDGEFNIYYRDYGDTWTLNGTFVFKSDGKEKTILWNTI